MAAHGWKSHLVVQNLVLLFHGSQEGILGQVVRAGRVLFIGAAGLLLEGLDGLGQQAGEVKVPALVDRESRALVEVGMVQQHGAHKGALKRAACA